MKKLLLSILLVASAATLSAQIILSGVSPASIEGNYEFTWADPGGGDWSCPDFNIPGTYIQAELMVVDDGSTGTNPQGNPLSAEGCNPLVNDLTGKIAVIFRNTCEFGTKALNAQNAGAVGAIIVNREEEVIGMGGGANGLSVTIPVGFIKLSDGLNLINAMQNGAVEMFFGNRAGIYANDLNLKNTRALIPMVSSYPSALAQNAGEFGFDIGAAVFNLGTDDQTNVTLSAQITDPNNSIVYDESVTGLGLDAISGNNIDSVDIMAWAGGVDSLPPFAPTSVMEGTYTLVYSVSNSGVTDDFPDDNEMTFEFQIDPNLFTYVRVDEDNMPTGSDFYRPSSNPSLYSICVNYQNDNADRMVLDAISFSASNTDFPLTDELFNITVYRWLDEFVDLNDPNVAFNGLAQAANVAYQFDDDLQRTPVMAELDLPLYMNAGERYLTCIQTNNGSVYLGHDTKVPYTYNQAVYLQPIQITESDGQYFAVGFGADVIPSIGLHMTDTASVEVPDTIYTTIGGTDVIIVGGDTFELWDDEWVPYGVEDHAVESMAIYPNPTSGTLFIESPEGFKNDIDVQITDLVGKTVMKANDAIRRGETRLILDVSSLSKGSYFVSLSSEGQRIAVEQIMVQ